MYTGCMQNVQTQNVGDDVRRQWCTCRGRQEMIDGRTQSMQGSSDFAAISYSSVNNDGQRQQAAEPREQLAYPSSFLTASSASRESSNSINAKPGGFLAILQKGVRLGPFPRNALVAAATRRRNNNPGGKGHQHGTYQILAGLNLLNSSWRSPSVASWATLPTNTRTPIAVSSNLCAEVFGVVPTMKV